MDNPQDISTASQILILGISEFTSAIQTKLITQLKIIVIEVSISPDTTKAKILTKNISRYKVLQYLRYCLY